MATTYNLFTDRRELEGNTLDAGDVLSLAHSAGADEVLSRLTAIDWAHPALLVYRSKDEDRWSFVTLGLRRPELGEGDG